MQKKKTPERENICPICGGIIWGKGQKVLIEGAKITVCDSCVQYGKKIITKTESLNIKKKYPVKKRNLETSKVSNKVNYSESTTEIVPDYAKKIRDIRTFNHLNQDQFAQKLNEKPSLIRRIESGKAEPTEKLAKKIESVYNIKLLKKAEDYIVSTKDYMKKQKKSSLGDIAIIKKKKNR